MSERAWRVVIVDDNLDDMEIVRTILEYYAIETHAVSGAAACRQLLTQMIPDLVITDLAMPEADGWAVLDAVRSSPDMNGTRVVAMTAYHSDKLANEVLTGGFDGYFPKPINPDDFIDRLNHIMGTHDVH